MLEKVKILPGTEEKAGSQEKISVLTAYVTVKRTHAYCLDFVLFFFSIKLELLWERERN